MNSSTSSFSDTPSRQTPANSVAGRLRRKGPAPLALEPRLVFDGAAGPEAVETGIAALAAPLMLPAEGEALTAEQTIFDALSVPDAVGESSESGEAPVTEVLFIDTSVADWQTLADHSREGVRIELLDPAKNAIDQILQALGGATDLDAVHIVSHGADGALMLGDLQLDAGNLDQYSEEVAQIGRALSEQGDLLLYGCDIASGADGLDFIGRLAHNTGADVAASDNATGAAAVAGDWSLERSTGVIESASFLTEEGRDAYHNWLSSLPLNTKYGWTAIAFGPSFDPVGDSQAGAADTDIVGGSAHGSLYVMFDDGGTQNPDDDRLAFRLRIDNPTSDTRFGGVAVVGIDGNSDGRVDLFVAVDGRNNGQVIRLLDPGHGLNDSPNTTTTSSLPSGWLSNDGVYAMASSNYSVVPVSASTDPHWTGNSDHGADGKTDVFVSWSVPLKDIATVMGIPSPADRNGVYGPRGSEGIAGFDRDTIVRYLAFTQTQTGPINGDLNGVGRSYDRNATFESLGAASEPMSAANPVASAPGITIGGPIGGDGIINASERGAVTITGGSSLLPENTTITITVSDGSASVTTTATTDGSGNWSAAGLDLSALAEGSLAVTASAGDVSAQSSVTHDSVAPLLSINTLAADSTGTPTFSGTSDLPDGSRLTVTVDHDNDGTTASLVYEALISGGIWTLDTALTPPVTGNMPSGGLTASAKVTAVAQDAAGNSVEALGLNRSTVDSVSTSSVSPVLSGYWTYVEGDSLTVSVGGATYELSPSGNRWSLDLSTAVPSSGTLELASGSTYEVVATATRDGQSLSDVSTGELTITNDPPVSIGIDGGESVSLSDPAPILTGTSANAGGFVIVRLDPGNEGDLSDAVTYSVTPAGLGDWALDLSTATPISGMAPTAGFLGAVGVYATDSTGDTSAVQTLNIAIPSIGISSILSTATSDAFGLVDNSSGGEIWLNATEDDAVSISGTAPDGFLVDVVVSDANGNTIEATGIAVAGGAWTTSGLDLSTLDSTQLTVTATLQGTQVSTSDTSVTHDALTPRIFVTNPSEIKKNGGVIYGVSELSNTSLTITVRDSSDTSTVGSWTTTTDASGNWTVTTSGNLVSGSSGTIIIRVAPTTSPVTDAAGNVVQTAEKIQTVTANASLNSISIGVVAGDDVISSDEIASGVSISGTTTLTGSGTVALSVTDGTTTVTTSGSYASGAWSGSLTTEQVQSLKNGQLTVTADVLDGTITISDTSFAVLSLPTPVPMIGDDVSGSASGPVTFTFQFSEGVTGFTADDVTVTNGSKGDFEQVSDTEYALVVTPAEDASGSIEVSVASNVATGLLSGRGNGDATTVQIFNTTEAAAAPDVTIDTSGLAQETRPVITGTSSLAAGAPIVISIDSDNDGDADLTYASIVQAGGTWSLDLSTATPASGTLPEDGLSPFARITATATNAYGNSSTVIGLNRPTVESQLTTDSTPTVSGIWTQRDGDALEVMVDGVTYSEANGNLTVTSTGWSLTPSGGDALANGAFDVTATVTRSSGGSVIDPTSGEVEVDTTAVVEISDGATTSLTADARPVIAGVSSGVPEGTMLTLTLDIGNDASGDVVYRVPVGADGSWSVDTSSAVPFSGAFPESGLSGDVLVTATATDPAGNTGTDTQLLTVDVASPSITLTFNAKTSDFTPLIVGMSDLPTGSAVTVEIDPNNDGDWSDVHAYVATVSDDGSWSVEATTDLSGVVGVRASGQDAAGNAAVTPVKALEIVNTAPSIGINALPSGIGEMYADSVVDGLEDDVVPVGGSTGNVAPGSTVRVSLTDGVNSINDTAVVGSDGSWSLEPLNLSAFGNGQITVTASVVDSDGSVYSTTYKFEHDKTAGAAVSVDFISSDTGGQGDFITRDSTLRFYGSATAGQTVVLDLSGPSGTFTGESVVASGSGSWSYDYSAVTLADGTYTLTATVGGTSVTQTIVVDTAAPVGAVTVDTQTTPSLTPTVTGVASLGTGEVLEVTLDGVTYRMGDGHLDHDSGTGVWTLLVPAQNALVAEADDDSFDGRYEVTAKVVDAARNQLVDVTTLELTVVSDSAPMITGPSGSAGAASSAVSVQENQTAVATLTADEAVHWFISGGADASLFEVDAATGELSFKAAPDFESPVDSDGDNAYLVEVRATDGSGNVSTQLIAVTVTDVDDVAPAITGPSGAASATSSVVSVPENQTAVTTLTADETASWSISGGADSLLFEVDAATGELSFKAAPDFESPQDSDGDNAYLVEVRATDGSGNVSTQLITVKVTDVDDVAPAITGPSGAAGTANSAVSVPENLTAVATLTADETASWSISGGADSLLFEVDAATGELSFKAAPDFESPQDSDADNAYLVEVRATDSSGNVSTQLITVTVTDVDDVAPAITGPSGVAGATSSAVSVQENQTAVTTLTADEMVSWSISGGADASLFEVDADTGELGFKASPDFESPADSDGDNAYLVEVRATDSSGNVSTQLITVTVTDVDNVTPAITGPSGVAGATSSAVSVQENQTAVTTLTADEAASWSISGGTDSLLFEVDAATGELSFKAAPDFESPQDRDGDNAYLVEVRATDGSGNSSTQLITVTVTDVDDVAPAITGPSGVAGATSSAVSVQENQTAVTTLTADEAASWSISGGTDSLLFEVDAATGELSFKAAPDFESPQDRDGDNAYLVEVRATDGSGNSSTQLITVTVTDVDEGAPTVDSLTTSQTTPLLTGTVSVSPGDTFSVLVNGESYVLGDGDLTLSGESWVLQIPAGHELPLGVFEVKAVVTREGAASLIDLTSREVTIITSPVAGDDVGVAREAGGISNTILGFEALGNLLENDAGQGLRIARAVTGFELDGDVKALSASESVSLKGNYGTLRLSSDGSYVYRVDDANLAVEALGPGGQLSETFLYELADRFGSVSSAVLRVAIEGAQDDQIKVTPVTPVVAPPVTVVPTTETVTPPSDPVYSIDRDVPTEPDVSGEVSFVTSSGDGAPEPVAGHQWMGDPGFEQSGGSSRVLIIPDEIPRLTTYKGMPDQYMQVNAALVFTIPTDAFAHTREDAQVVFQAVMADGAPLPEWLSFDSESGTFSGVPPDDLRGELSVKVIARDSSGQQAEAVFRIFVSKPGDGNQSSRPELQHRLRAVAYLNR